MRVIGPSGGDASGAGVCTGVDVSLVLMSSHPPLLTFESYLKGSW